MQRKSNTLIKQKDAIEADIKKIMNSQNNLIIKEKVDQKEIALTKQEQMFKVFLSVLDNSFMLFLCYWFRNSVEILPYNMN